MVRIRVPDVDGDAQDVQGVLAALRGVAIDGAAANGAADVGLPPLPLPKPSTAEGMRTCVVCGCTDDAACEGGCSWAERYDEEITGPLMGLCTRCVELDKRAGRGGRKPKAEGAARKTSRRAAHRPRGAGAPAGAPAAAETPAAPATIPPPGVEEVKLADDVGVTFDDNAPGGAVALITRQGRGRHRHCFEVPASAAEVGTGKVLDAGCRAGLGPGGRQPCPERRRFMLT